MDGWLTDNVHCQDLFENAEYHTLGGLILQQLQHIPTSGETLQWNGFHLEIVDMDGARIDKVLVTVSPQGTQNK